MTRAHSVSARVMASFAGTSVPDWLMSHIERGLGGVVLFAGNISSDAQAGALCARMREARDDVVIAVDEEGGDVTRLDAPIGSLSPTAETLGVIDDAALTRRVAEALGGRLRAIGFDLALAPVADVNSNPANPIIGVRSFGADPALVARHVTATVDGLHIAGVAACAKHFPGHGDTALDSHLSTVTSPADLATLRGREFPPFAAAVAAGTEAIMTTHVLVTALDDIPATFSARWHTFLRDEFGFGGAIISDALDMAGAGGHRGPGSLAAAAGRALGSGVDMVCLGSNLGPADVDAVVAHLGATAGWSEPAHEAALARVARLHRCASPERGASLTTGNYVEIARQALGDLTPAESVLGGARRAFVAECLAQGNSSNHNVAWGVRRQLPPEWPGCEVRASDAPGTVAAAAGDCPIVVVTRDTAVYQWQVAFVRALTAEPGVNRRVVVVEMGSPAEGLNPGDGSVVVIRTHGASRAGGIAVARWLADLTRENDG